MAAVRWRGRPRLGVHPLFAVLLALGAAAGLGREVAVLCLVLAGHELAHLMVLHAFRLRVAALEFLPFGAVLRVEGLELADPGVEAAVALAGPLHNLFWLAVGFVLRETGWLEPHAGTFFLVANAVVGAGNLLPALPLDGGRAARAMLAVGRGTAAATRAVARAGWFVGGALCAAALAAAARGVFVPGAFIFGGFVLLRARPERQAGAVRPWREMLARGAGLDGRRALPILALAVSPELPLRELVTMQRPHHYHLVWVVGPSGRARGPWDEADVLDAVRRGGADASAATLSRDA